jgi:cytoskeletal protein CcmA (bactofilin family)
MLKQDPKKKEQDIPPDIQASAGKSLIGRSLILEGDISGSEDLTVEGRVQGTINLENNTLVVAPTGRIKADIRVKNINIQGQVNGQIHSTGKVFISEQGKMNGDITARRISIQDGAQFKGSVKMMSAITS